MIQFLEGVAKAAKKHGDLREAHAWDTLASTAPAVPSEKRAHSITTANQHQQTRQQLRVKKY
jgi:hypothetical protein